MSIEGRTFTLKDEISLGNYDTIEVYGVYPSNALFKTSNNDSYDEFYMVVADSVPTITYIRNQTEDEVYSDGWYDDGNKTITFLNEPEYYLMDDSAVNEEVFIEWLEANSETESAAPISGLVTDRQLTAIANAIREKGGTNETLVFPDGFITAIQNLNVVNQN